MACDFPEKSSLCCSAYSSSFHHFFSRWDCALLHFDGFCDNCCGDNSRCAGSSGILNCTLDDNLVFICNVKAYPKSSRGRSSSARQHHYMAPNIFYPNARYGNIQRRKYRKRSTSWGNRRKSNRVAFICVIQEIVMFVLIVFNLCNLSCIITTAQVVSPSARPCSKAMAERGKGSYRREIVRKKVM